MRSYLIIIIMYICIPGSEEAIITMYQICHKTHTHIHMQICCGLVQLPHTSMVDCLLLVMHSNVDRSKRTADMLWEEHATADTDSSHRFEREWFKTVKPLMKNYHFSEFSLHTFMSVSPWPATMPLLRPLLLYFWQPLVECSCCKIYIACIQWLFPHGGVGGDTLFHSLTVLWNSSCKTTLKIKHGQS